MHGGPPSHISGTVRAESLETHAASRNARKVQAQNPRGKANPMRQGKGLGTRAPQDRVLDALAHAGTTERKKKNTETTTNSERNADFPCTCLWPAGT